MDSESWQARGTFELRCPLIFAIFGDPAAQHTHKRDELSSAVPRVVLGQLDPRFLPHDALKLGDVAGIQWPES